MLWAYTSPCAMQLLCRYARARAVSVAALTAHLQQATTLTKAVHATRLHCSGGTAVHTHSGTHGGMLWAQLQLASGSQPPSVCFSSAGARCAAWLAEASSAGRWQNGCGMVVSTQRAQGQVQGEPCPEQAPILSANARSVDTLRGGPLLQSSKGSHCSGCSTIRCCSRSSQC